MWFGELVDIRSYSDGGQDLFVRLAASEIGMFLFLSFNYSLIMFFVFLLWL
jgi:hypothetical protein